MSVSAVRWLVLAYMAVFIFVTTWPGVQLFNHVYPLVLGLPFNLFVIALVIIGALGVLAALYVSEQRVQRDDE